MFAILPKGCRMLLLLLVLPSPQLADRVQQAWTDLGLRGIQIVESAGCPAPGRASLPAFPHLPPGGRFCYALLLAPAPSPALAEQAAAAVERIAGPWGRSPGTMLLALPVTANWGVPAAEGERRGP